MKLYNKIERRMCPMGTLIIGMLIGIVSTTIISANLMHVQATDYEIKLDEKDAEIVQLNEQHEKELTACKTQYESRIAILEAKLAEVQDLYDTLLNDISTYEGDISFSTLTKYWYVFKTADPNCGLTAGMVQLADDLCQEKDLNPDVVWTIFRLESRYRPDAQNPKSTARGLGQTVISTAKYVYETLMGNGKGTYSHEMAYNGYTSIKMTVAYVDYLRNTYGNLRSPINGYSGDQTGTYYNKFATYMSEFGHSLTDLTYAGQHAS